MKHALGLLLCLSVTPSTVAAEPAVALKVNDTTVDVSIGDEPFTTYHFASDLPKPYFSPVRAADGTIITRPLEKPADHPHHKGIWLSIDEVNGIKFWAEKGKIRNVSVKPLESTGSPARLQVVNHWLDPETDEPALIETTTISIYPNRLLAYDITFSAPNGSATFEDTKEGLFGIRLRDSMREKEGGHVVNADGLEGSKAAWGKPSKWVDYFGEAEGKTYGVAIFDHPENFRPSRYHVRDYGLFSINPFGEKAYTGGKSEAQHVEVAADKPLRLRYGIYIHEGNPQEGRVSEVFERYVTEAR